MNNKIELTPDLEAHVKRIVTDYQRLERLTAIAREREIKRIDGRVWAMLMVEVLQEENERAV